LSSHTTLKLSHPLQLSHPAAHPPPLLTLPAALTSRHISTAIGARRTSLCVTPTGTYSNATNLTSVDDCTVTPAGFFSTIRTAAPLACPPGYFSAQAGAAMCSRCPAGTYQGESAKTGCKSCDPGAYCLLGASAPIVCPAVWSRVRALRGPLRVPPACVHVLAAQLGASSSYQGRVLANSVCQATIVYLVPLQPCHAKRAHGQTPPTLHQRGNARRRQRATSAPPEALHSRRAVRTLTTHSRFRSMSWRVGLARPLP